MSNNATLAVFATQESEDTLPFYEVEGRVLALWDQLKELKLEEALLEAQLTLPLGAPPLDDESLDAQLEEAEAECLEARAAYMLSQSILEDILTANPILKAVHSGANVTATERSLHPLVDRRDVLAIAHTRLSSSLQSILGDTAVTEVGNLRTLEQNRELNTALHAITKKIQGRRDSAIAQLDSSVRLDQVRRDTTIASKRWRVMKSVVAAIVAGSGVDWARNGALRDLVVDEESEADWRG